MDILKNYPKTYLSALPTPINRLKNISQIYGANIYIKRDDLTGIAFGGNKARKLDYLIADAISKGADTIVTVGAIQSNFCRMLTAAANSNGLTTHLVLGGKKPDIPTGNLYLNYILGADITFIESDKWEHWEQQANFLVQQLESRGKKVYFIPMGGSVVTGILGYVEAFDEIVNYSKKTGINFDTIIVPTTTGGTQAGLIVGKEISSWRGRIIGMGVAKTRAELSQKIFNLVIQTAMELGVTMKQLQVIIDNSYMGNYYGEISELSERTVALFAKQEGILLDYIYTAKAAAGMIDYIVTGEISKKENILLIHTGGNIQLFE